MKCTASPGFIARNRKNIPEDTGSEYSREGDLAHALAASTLLLGFDESVFPNKEMAIHVKGYKEKIDGWLALNNAILQVETKVPLFYSPTKRTGTVDACVITDHCIFIGDLKYGAGVSVAARNNTQIAIYAMSKVRQLEESGLYSFNPTTIVGMMIYQPRVIGEPAVRLWETTLGVLRQFCEDIEKTAKAIEANPDGGVFAPSDKTCQFCPAASLCSARAGYLLGGMEIQNGVAQLEVAEEPELPPVELLTIKQLAKIIQFAPQIRLWLDKCETTGAAILHEGKNLPGFKLVAGRSTRKWSDPAEVIELCSQYGIDASELFTQPELISPAQMETLVKLRKAEGLWTLLDSLVHKPEGKPTLVPEEDQRPAFRQNVANLFDVLDS